MGGKFSHEFHLISKCGEDDIYICKQCNLAYNKETLNEEKLDIEKDIKKINQCPECELEMEHKNSIEIGHTFYLGTRYSERLNAIYIDNNKNKLFLEMCCFGIGVTRILSAFITQQQTIEIDWPLKLAPYHILIIPPKKGSKENQNNLGTKLSLNIANSLKLKGFDILIDNRDELTIGRRQIDSLAFGFPFKIIIGKKSIEDIPKFELHNKDEKLDLTHSELLNRFDSLSKKLF